MPCIADFHGISVHMYFRDLLPPHIHAFHGEHEVVIEIRGASVLGGNFPPSALTKIRRWVRLRRQMLEANWMLARMMFPLMDVPSIDEIDGPPP